MKYPAYSEYKDSGVQWLGVIAADIKALKQDIVRVLAEGSGMMESMLEMRLADRQGRQDACDTITSNRLLDILCLQIYGRNSFEIRDSYVRITFPYSRAPANATPEVTPEVAVKTSGKSSGKS
jgi:hypothetical protein